jgi:hypothetical protein
MQQGHLLRFGLNRCPAFLDEEAKGTRLALRDPRPKS